MPSSKIKNHIYRLSLNFAAPSAAHSVYNIEGAPLKSFVSYKKLIRKHHVLGSAFLISCKNKKTKIFSSSVHPLHNASDSTYFRIASLTKMAVVLLSLRLCEENLLALDEPVSTFLPDGDTVHFLKEINLRHFLSHTSGLSDPVDLEYCLKTGKSWTEILSRPELKFDSPGKQFRYNNFAFGLLGCMIEYVTGQSIEEAFRERLFLPLGLNATFDPTTLPFESIMPISRILPYRKNQDTIIIKTANNVNEYDPLHHYGFTAGGLYTDLDSIHILLHTIASGGEGYLKTDIGNQATKEHASYKSLDHRLSYGLGLFILKDSLISSHRILGHQGFAYGCVNGAFMEEDTGRTVIMLNGGCSEARDGRMACSNLDFLRWAFKEEIT